MQSSSIYTARTDDLVAEDVGAEVLIYDKRTDVAHCLTAVAARVWRACAHGASLTELVDRVSRASGEDDPESLVLASLAELSDKDLLETTTGVSRRQAMQRLAGMGMAAASVPLVVSAVVTTPAMATSGGSKTAGSTCTASSECSGTLVCTNGVSGTGQTYCNTATCLSNGTVVATCTGGNSLCCSTRCGGSSTKTCTT